MQKITLSQTLPNSQQTNDQTQSLEEQTHLAHQAGDGQSPTTGVDETQKISQNQNSDQMQTVKPIAFTKNEDSMKKNQKRKILIISICALAAGIGSGFGAYRLQQKTELNQAPIQQVAGDTINKGDVFGMQDSSTFSDPAVGYLESGGVNGEGSHRLLRIGGPSQTVYLTSSVTDLDKLVGMEVKVWGETYKGQVAGWLMDVGKVEVINPDAQPPLDTEL